ncbi:MAG: ABC transporter permease [Hyphomicrobiales bacterium]|nr:FtsX-like permease family protein [Hyphomicrobiales bacterium]PCJ84360.1 MAG: ABC transporter permease [Hyphomicrobiales bacterium]
MTAFLTRILGRLPIGWLQLVHNKGRLASAIAGVAFANILIFMQLGFLGALIESVRLPYAAMNAQIIISGSDMNTLSDGSPLPRQRMFEALSVPGVATATPLYLAKLNWKQSDGTERSLDIFGVDPSAKTFKLDEINDQLKELTLSDRVLIDRTTRNVPKQIFEDLDNSIPYVFETRGRTLTMLRTFAIGGGFTVDGYMVVSDQTFLNLYPERVSGAPNHILVTLEDGQNVDEVVERLQARLPSYDSLVQTIDQAVAGDQNFQTTQKPVGLIFGFGVGIGVLVGIIIVYQVLSSDVADHLREYATFKAIGYPQRFFLGIIFEEAFILALFGFIPGVIISTILYALVASKTGLPLAMPFGRPILVLMGTFAMCGLSGAIATRRLANANPADLF